MKKRLLSLMTMWLLISVCLSMIPSQRVEAASKVAISATKKTLQVGQTCKLSLKNAGKVSWKTGNKSVAVVTAKGKNTAVVKAKHAGKVTITAYYKGKRYSCKVTVENPTLNATHVQLYSLDEESRSFGAGSTSYRQEFQFKVKGTSQRVRSWWQK